MLVCTITCCTQSPKTFNTSQVEQIDSIVESKVDPTFTDSSKYLENISMRFDKSMIPMIQIEQADAFNMCVTVCLKKNKKINDKLFLQEWNRNYNSVYKYFNNKTISDSTHNDTLTSADITQ